MLLTVIPYFKEVIVVSFRCEHCGEFVALLPTSFRNGKLTLRTQSRFAGYTNNDIQAAGEIQSSGAVYTVKITDRKDLNRQLVKSEHCIISIPEYSLQIPAARGQFTTVEGIISDTIRDLSQDQPVRLEHQPEIHAKIQELIEKLRLIVDESSGGSGSDRKIPVFTIKLDDPSGNSFIETEGGLTDPKWSKREYTRDNQQNDALGLAPTDTVDTSHYPEEVLSFPGQCSLCGSALETLMKTVNIPHFKVRSRCGLAMGLRDTRS